MVVAPNGAGAVPSPDSKGDNHDVPLYIQSKFVSGFPQSLHPFLLLPYLAYCDSSLPLHWCKEKIEGQDAELTSKFSLGRIFVDDTIVVILGGEVSFLHFRFGNAGHLRRMLIREGGCHLLSVFVTRGLRAYRKGAATTINVSTSTYSGDILATRHFKDLL